MRVVVDGAVDVPLSDGRITSVPARVFKDESDWSGSSEEFWAQLREDPVGWSTAAPSRADLAEAYAGTEPVLAVHVSAELSATLEHARAAAGDAMAGGGSTTGGAAQPGSGGAPVSICDSRSLSVGSGLVASQVLAEDPRSLEDALRQARSLVGHVHTYGLIDQVDYLIRSGRVALLAGTHLRSKRHYLLAIRGHAIPLGDCRNRAKAFDSLLEHVRSTAPHGVGAWALSHGASSDVEELAGRATRTLGRAPEFVMLLDPTVGIHVGPDAVVVAAVGSPAVGSGAGGSTAGEPTGR